jgi:hypothetical protein
MRFELEDIKKRRAAQRKLERLREKIVFSSPVVA